MGADPLNAMADIHLPDPIGFWPVAPGWWVVLFLLVCLAIWGLVLLRRYLHRLRLFRTAMRELQRCQEWLPPSADTGTARIDYLNAVNAVLRRVALARYPRSTIASLTGHDWVEFLRGHGDLDALDEQGARALAEGRFTPHCQYDPDTIHRAARQWIRSQYLSGVNTGQSSGETAAHHA